MKHMKRILPIFAIMCMVFTTLFGELKAQASTTIVHAVSELYSLGNIYSTPVRTDIKKTTDGNIVYCLNSGKDSPAVDGTEYIQNGEINEGVYTILVNGYPSKSVQELGFQNEKEAYFATQVAVWGFINGDTYAEGFNSSTPNMEEVVNDLIAKAKNPTEKEQIYINVNPGTTTASVEGNHFKTEAYTVESNGIDTTYSVKLVNAPSGTKVVDAGGQEKTTFNVNEKFHVVFPKDTVSGQFSVTVTAKAGQLAGLFLQSTDESIQNVGMLSVKNVDVVKDNLTVKWESNGSLEILKKDGKGNALAGAKFAVKNGFGELVATVESGANGRVVVSNLPIGIYKVQEIESPEGFLLNAQSFNVTVKTGETATLEIVNEQIVGAVQITKKGSDGKLLEGVEFTIYNNSDEEMAKGVTGEEGILTINNLPYGKGYYAVETKGVEGYVPSSEKHYFDITGQASSHHGGEVAIEVINKQIIGSLLITKTDAADDNTKLKDAEFTIYDEIGEVVITGKTAENGEAHFDNLPAGKYTYKETEAPNGYVLGEETFEFEIKEDGEIVKHTVTNKQVLGSLVITKTDAVDGNIKLKDAEFTIYDEIGEVVITGKTAENGEAHFDNLPAGKYTYKEMEAPNGYVIGEETFEFEIKEDGEIIKHTVTNEKIPVEVKEEPKVEVKEKPKPETKLPQTGESSTLPVVIGGLTLVFVGIVLYVRNKKQNKEV